ncbi:MAG TPA: toll/interleukin-1 receptor domain-containing protein, partial [Magnetospirillum sp.]|nr:toll/interleukin-1 receptor domain-containing protein [Magnetospirillum sp.]
MPGSFDVFLSYARVDSALADPLVQALERAGVTVWRDTEQIETFRAIRQAIDEGLARSKVLLALYSRAYTERRACDWELAAAFIAGGPDRILVLNPEKGADHIQPQSLREQKFANPDDFGDFDALAAKIKARVAGIDGSFGQLPKPAADQEWFGLSPKGAAQTFVGRRGELWQVHGALTAGGSAMVAPTTTGLRPGDGSTMVRGLGGMGKTLLAEEYARRFAAAWPGGVFWLKAGGGDADGPISESRLLDQYLALARALTLSFDPAEPASLRKAVETAMAARPGPYLWVVDDLPHGLNTEQARAWFAPTVSLGCTLVTTRTRTLNDIATPVELAELGEDEAYILLTLDRQPKNETETKAARAIVEELGRHALAVDLARHLVRIQGYGKVLADLRNPGKEALGLAAKLSVELPTGHEKSIAQTFLRSIQLLDGNGLDALRVAAHLAPHTPIPSELLTAIRMQADGPTAEQAEEDAVLAMDKVAARSLCEITDAGYVVHALVCRTMALRYADDRSLALKQAGVTVLTRLFRQADDARNHPRLVPLLPHAHAASEVLETAEQADLISWVARYYYAAGLYLAAKQHYARELEALRRILGPDHSGTLISIGNLATTLSDLGDLLGARNLQQQVLETRRRILGPDHPDTLISMGNLAGTLFSQGDLAGARDLQQQTLEARRRIL